MLCEKHFELFVLVGPVCLNFRSGLLITRRLMGLQWCMKLHCGSSEEFCLCIRVCVAVSSSNISGSVLMNLKPVGPFKWEAQGTDVVVVDVYVDEYELEKNTVEVHLT